MLDSHSAIASTKPYTSERVSLAEAPDFTLVQTAWFSKADEKGLKESFGSLPAKVGQTTTTDHGLLFRTGPHQLWLVTEHRNASLPDLSSSIVTTPLSSGRTRIAINGESARAVLARCAPIDFHPSAFKPGQFVMTGIHHTPVLMHCTAEHSFHVYALRTFGLAVWEWLEDAAQGLIPLD